MTTRVYVYQAGLHCETCGEAIKRDLDAAGMQPDFPENESTFDSDDYPKGPYGDAGGEADTPQHCDSCGGFLGNPLTDDGAAYVASAFAEYAETGRGNADVLEEWREFYGPAFVTDFRA